MNQMLTDEEHRARNKLYVRSIETATLPVKPSVIIKNPIAANKKVTVRCPLDIIKKIRDILPAHGSARFHSLEQLGKFLDLPINGAQFSGMLAHQLLLNRIDCNKKGEIWFSVLDKPCRFSVEEFCLITGLHCGEGPSQVEISRKMSEISEKQSRKGDNILVKDKFWPSKSGVQLKDVRNSIEKALNEGEVGTKGIVELAILYLVEGFLLTSDPKKFIDNETLHLLNDVEFFDSLPWGRRCYQTLISSLNGIDMAKKMETLENDPSHVLKYNIYGCAWILQIWAYEAIPDIGKYMAERVNSQHIGRWFHWLTNEKMRFRKDLLESKDGIVRPMLRPSPEEEGQSYWQLTHLAIDEEDFAIDSLVEYLWGNVELHTSRVVEEGDRGDNYSTLRPSRGESSSVPERGEDTRPSMQEAAQFSTSRNIDADVLDNIFKAHEEKVQSVLADQMILVECKVQTMMTNFEASLVSKVKSILENHEKNIVERMVTTFESSNRIVVDKIGVITDFLNPQRGRDQQPEGSIHYVPEYESDKGRVVSQKNKIIDRLSLVIQEEKDKKQKYWERVIELEKRLSVKEAIELEAITNSTGNEEVRLLNGKVGEMVKELEDKEQRLGLIEDMNQVLTVKEHRARNELDEARNKLISLLDESSGSASIGVKRMGDLKTEPFLAAAERMYDAKLASTKALELSSEWDKNIRDSSWHPFKVIKIKGKHEEIIDKEDEKLKALRSNYGGEVYEAVTEALKELNEYNPSGRYPIKELWNFKEERKASVEEAIEFVRTDGKRRKIQ